MTDLNETERGQCIRLAYRSQDHETRSAVDFVSWQLQEGVKERAGLRNMMFGPVSAMELTWALARLAYQRRKYVRLRLHHAGKADPILQGGRDVWGDGGDDD